MAEPMVVTTSMPVALVFHWKPATLQRLTIGRHFKYVIIDQNSQQGILVIDFKDAGNKIEKVTFSDGEYSYEQIVVSFYPQSNKFLWVTCLGRILTLYFLLRK